MPLITKKQQTDMNSCAASVDPSPAAKFSKFKIFYFPSFLLFSFLLLLKKKAREGFE